MPYHIKKPHVLDPNKTVYWEGGINWNEDYSKRKTYVNKGTADAKIVNNDGKNGGFIDSVVVEE